MKTEERTDPERLDLKVLINYLNAADSDYALAPGLTDELRTDVRRLLDPPPIPTRARPGMDMSPREYWLRVVGKKVAAMKISRTRGVISLGDRPYRYRPYRLRLGNEVFFYADSPRITGHRHERERKIAYWILDLTLVSGEFSQVRVCRQCSKFFASYRQDAQACSPDCNREYHNKKYQREGKFRDSYSKRKKEKLNLARKLKARGKPRHVIIDESGLTELVLIRAGILEREP